MTLVNLPPHDIHIFPAGTPDLIEPGTITPTHTIAPAPHTVRLGHRVIDSHATSVDGIVVDDVAFGAEGAPADWLPEPRDGVWYLVSLPVGLAATHRVDLLVVHEPVRDPRGNALGCRRLARPYRATPPTGGLPAGADPAASRERHGNRRTVKSWCNYAVHRTTSSRRASGSKQCKIARPGTSRRHAYQRNEQWWRQR